MTTDERYMTRCLQLAVLGAGNVAPNPMVGAVLVYEDRIIGEGCHEKYGSAHAEVNCIASVKNDDIQLIEKSTLYVSLEPCNHYGKTPPCSELIIDKKIPKVIIGCKDILKDVAGKGILKLQRAGVDVTTGILETQSIELNKRFFTFHEKFRPYIILKWAQSVNSKIGLPGKRVFITNEYTNRLVHKWRSEEAAILVGTNTVLTDDPSLTVRLWEGKSPVRMLIDRDLKVPLNMRVYNSDSRTIVFNLKKNLSEENITYVKLGNEKFLQSVVAHLFEINIQSVIVEGGRKILQSFIDAGLWDEARVITNKELTIEGGVDAPQIKNFKFIKQETSFNDFINYYGNG